MLKPKISVILPCYNVGKYIATCLDSIINNSFKDLEIICVDDKSTDDTVNVIQHYMTQDPRIILIEQKQNYGVGRARNTGLSKAQGKYVCFLDPDDWIDENFIELLYDNIGENDVIKSGLKTVNDNSINISSLNKLIDNNVLNFNAEHYCCLYKKSFLLNNNIIYPEDVKTGQDAVFVSNIVLHTNKIKTENRTFYYYRGSRPGSLDSAVLSHAKVLSRLKMLDYKLEMLKTAKFSSEKDKEIFIIKHIMEHYKYLYNAKKEQESDNELVFEWLYKNQNYLTKKHIARFFNKLQMFALHKHNFKLFSIHPKYTHIFYKERLENGRRHIYFCGIKIISYKHKQTKSARRLKGINYKQYNDLAFDIKRNITKIPLDIDLIVGVPRSGIIPAYMISFALNKQVCSLPEFLDGKFGENGLSRKINKSDNIRKVLIIDDSCDSGTAMKSVKERLSGMPKKYEYVFAAVYGTNKNAFKYCDVVLEILPQPRMFQWNYSNHGFLQNAGFDMDGVLCVDPTDYENDDGEKYIDFILNAKPLYIPKVKIGAIITSRLGKYRPQTEQWLKEHGVEYEKLYMLENMTAEQRRERGVHVKYKASIYKKHPELQIFVESEDSQAKEIAALSGKQCFCIKNDKLY